MCKMSMMEKKGELSSYQTTHYKDVIKISCMGGQWNDDIIISSYLLESLLTFPYCFMKVSTYSLSNSVLLWCIQIIQGTTQRQFRSQM